MKKLVLVLVGIFLSPVAWAEDGLVVHTAEFGVGKFHRQDNKVHSYGADNNWAPYILPDNANTSVTMTRKNPDDSFTIFFSTLDDLISAVTALSRQEGKKVAILNVHGHGLPGAMWFPKDQATMNGVGCWDWTNAANGADQDNYNQYYSAVSVEDIRQIRQMSNNPNVRMNCTVGLPEWRQGVAKAPQFPSVFTADAQIHFLSCVVGLGAAGDAFTKGVAALLLPAGGRVYTSINFGLGDWSMPEGMGFWDMQSAEQVRRDNANYSANHRDSEIAQKGTIRVAAFTNNNWTSGLLADRDFMSLQAEPLAPTFAEELEVLGAEDLAPLPSAVRVPGTNVYVGVQAN